MVGVQWQVGRAGLEHGHLGDDEFGRSGQGEADDALGPGAPRDERVGEPVGALVQLGVGEPDVAEDQGDGVRAAAYLLGEHLGPGERRHPVGGVVPLDEDAPPLIGGQRFRRRHFLRNRHWSPSLSESGKNRHKPP
ncbi:hypothetical protein GCM10007964_32580 [Sphaerisporangium melleum]|uniref:Uncharacterized protein n=1 Tax=Sphaerisporangium melleum TaxID=321316 RepID=A0A917R473_9ACTN|nr:hypothetical protein GCM10007964_32580 [Sphaerisporangium melleum]